jgi:hypothetical protein
MLERANLAGAPAVAERHALLRGAPVSDDAKVA